MKLAAIIMLATTVPACVVEDDNDPGATSASALANAPVAPTVPGAASGERFLAPAGPVTASVFHPRLALMRPQAMAGIIPCSYTQGVVLYTASGKAYPSLVDADFRGTGLALVALDRPSAFAAMAIATTASLVGTELTCYGSYSRTQVAATTTHVTTATELRKAKHVPWPLGSLAEFQPSDIGMACFDSRPKLVATHEHAPLPDSGRVIVFDPDDTTYAIARAAARCGYTF